MKKDVLVQVKGLQIVDENGNEEPIEIIVPGQYYFRNDCHYLRYEEILDESAEPTVNYIRLTEKAMEVRKQGLVNVQMIFEPGRKSLACYNTPFGALQMGITATQLVWNKTEDMLDIHVEYALDLNDQFVADCYLSIQAKNKNVWEGV